MSNLLLNHIYCGDCLTTLKNFPSNSIDVIITSPPYFQQREYTGIGVGRERSLNSYIDNLTDDFSEFIRVIKPTGNIFYNIGDKIDRQKGTLLVPYRFAIKIMEEYSNLLLINNITWVKTNPTPRQFKKRLVSSTEPFFHFVKSMDYHYFPDKFIAPSRKKKNKPTEKLGLTYFKLIEESILSKNEKIEAIKSVKNAIEEVKSKKIEGFRVKIRGIHAPAFGGGEGGRNNQIIKNGFTVIKLKGNPLKKDVMINSVESVRGTQHPAIYPLKLIKELIKLTCPDNSVVLDPYSGSGTTLLAAKELKKNYIGIDINPKYCNYAQERLS